MFRVFNSTMCLVATMLDSVDGENAFERSKKRAVAVNLEENGGLGIETKGEISEI